MTGCKSPTCISLHSAPSALIWPPVCSLPLSSALPLILLSRVILLHRIRCRGSRFGVLLLILAYRRTGAAFPEHPQDGLATANWSDSAILADFCGWHWKVLQQIHSRFSGQPLKVILAPMALFLVDGKIYPAFFFFLVTIDCSSPLKLIQLRKKAPYRRSSSRPRLNRLGLRGISTGGLRPRLPEERPPRSQDLQWRSRITDTDTSRLRYQNFRGDRWMNFYFYFYFILIF